MITTQRAREHGIKAQRKNETDFAFRDRVSGILRDAGHLVEAHEAFRDRLFDQSDDVVSGIVGAMVQAIQEKSYGAMTGQQQIGDDVAVGALAGMPDNSDDGMLAVLTVMMGLKK